jgi:hypothetical protein
MHVAGLLQPLIILASRGFEKRKTGRALRFTASAEVLKAAIGFMRNRKFKSIPPSSSLFLCKDLPDSRDRRDLWRL